MDQKQQVKPWAFYYYLFSLGIYRPKIFGPTLSFQILLD